jgi:hypothetical protein
MFKMTNMWAVRIFVYLSNSPYTESVLLEAIHGTECLNCIPINLQLLITYIMWRDAWTPEACSQKSTEKTSVARQRLAETRFRGNQYACINQHVALRLSYVSWQQRITEESTVGLGALYLVCIKLFESEIETAREREFQRIEDWGLTIQ